MTARATRALLMAFLTHLHRTGCLEATPSETWIDAFLGQR